MRHTTIIFILTIFIFACQSRTENKIIKNREDSQHSAQRKIKSITSISFVSNYFSPDSLVFEEKVIRNFDTLNHSVEMLKYIIDSTILYEHHYQKFIGDTLLKIEKSIGNVFKPKIIIDTSKYLNSNIIERKSTTTYQYAVDENGNDIEIPLPTKVFYKYDNKSKLISTKQIHDKDIYQCTYSYNGNNELVEKSCSNNDNSKNSYVERVYYNEKGLKIQQTETSYESDKMVAEYKRLYSYDLKDSLIYQSWYKNGENYLIFNYLFNEQGQKLAEYTFNDSSKDSTMLSQQLLYYYDGKGNLKMLLIIGKNGDPMQTELYSYKNDGSLFEKRRFTHTINSDKRAVLTRLVTQYYYEYY